MSDQTRAPGMSAEEERRLLRELSVQQRKKEIEEELLVLQAMEEKIRDTLDGLELEEVALRAMISTPEEDEDMTDYSSDT